MIYLTERWHWQDGYWTEWQCEPPGEGIAFKVVHDEWREDVILGTVRAIHQVELTGHRFPGEPRRPEQMAIPADRVRWKES